MHHRIGKCEPIDGDSLEVLTVVPALSRFPSCCWPEIDNHKARGARITWITGVLGAVWNASIAAGPTG
jgi:hypothetical protein